MRPRITLMTLGVDDLERSLRFYRDGLGFPTQGIVGTEYEHGAVAFFDLQKGFTGAFKGLAKGAHQITVTGATKDHALVAASQTITIEVQ